MITRRPHRHRRPSPYLEEGRLGPLGAQRVHVLAGAQRDEHLDVDGQLVRQPIGHRVRLEVVQLVESVHDERHAPRGRPLAVEQRPQGRLVVLERLSWQGAMRRAKRGAERGEQLT